MRYLTLSANYGAFSLRDDQPGAVDASDLQLPPELRSDLASWNHDYQVVIPASVEQRRTEPMAALIRDLDCAGLILAKRVSAVVDGRAKVRYYSEGLLRHIQ